MCVWITYWVSSLCCSAFTALHTVAGTVSGCSRLHMTVDLGGLSAGRLAGPEGSSSSSGGGGSSRPFNALLVTASFCTAPVRNVFGQQRSLYCFTLCLCIQITLFVLCFQLQARWSKKRLNFKDFVGCVTRRIVAWICNVFVQSEISWQDSYLMDCPPCSPDKSL